MDAVDNNVMWSSKMALPIDLNEMPTSSPRGSVHNAVGGTDVVSICPICRKGVSVGVTTEGQRVEDKCFRCMLKNNSSRGSGGSVSKVGMGRFDINAPPPSEMGDGDDLVVVAGWDSGKLPASVPPLYQHSDGNISTVISDSGLWSSHCTLSDSSSESPGSLYLQTLREFIAERSGLHIEGWHVEFEFCNKRYKTTAVYIGPDGSRCTSVEDVAQHLGLPSQPHHEKGSNDILFVQRGSKFDPPHKESPASPANLNYRQGHKALWGNNRQGFPTSYGISGSSKHGSNQDRIYDGYPIQFKDFCIISTGNIDPRPTYHSVDQIWPVGYRCSWHDKVSGSLFVCDVADGGDCGPLFKVQRYPCISRYLPAGSTILSKPELFPFKDYGMVGKDGSSVLQMLEDDCMSTITLLNEDGPPCLDNCLYISNRDDTVNNSLEDDSSNSDMQLSQKDGSFRGEAVPLSDAVGEFQVEGRSASSVWEMVSQNILCSFRENFEQQGTIRLFCSHDMYGVNKENLDSGDSLSRFGCLSDLRTLPALVKDLNEFNRAFEILSKWLKLDRFGLDLDFVQEFIEQLPGVNCCSEYKNLNDRVLYDLKTVGSGFFHVDKRTISSSGVPKLSEITGTTDQNPCPLGKPLKSRLPTYLIGDALQVWELIWRFTEVIGLGEPFSFMELESELVSPWLDNYSFDSRHRTAYMGNAASSSAEKVSHRGPASPDRFSGLLLMKVLVSLVRLLVRELLSRAAVYVCPNSDTVESKTRKGKKKDMDPLAAFNKRKLDILPVNEITWHEMVRRYTLAVLAMEGNFDSAEIAQRESGKVFQCLQGDGGILCGSLMGIAALECDALVLADAMKEIFGSLKSKNEIITVCENDFLSCGSQTIEVSDSVIPEWAQALEPVRKLPTNVGARIRRCINEALELNPPDWARKELEHSISKEVYKGNASGPTKRAVISVLANVNKDIPQPKTEKKEKVKVKTNIVDLVTKQCRVVLRRAVSSDDDKVFCSLLARIPLNSSDNDDGVLGHPAMVSRPLDFRTIDLRLDAGAYGGSHEAFVDDVREVWRNIRTAYADRSDLVDLSNKLSEKFEELYEEEVLSLVHKIAAASSTSEPSTDSVKARDDLLFHVFNTSLPRAPWEDGICKVCGMDKDDDNVLLCDKCDSEYHRYCLNPPLQKIPDGNWYCPSCVAAGQSVSSRVAYGAATNQCRKSRNSGEYSSKFMEDLTRFANLLEIKECWELTIEERIFLLKFCSNEVLNSACIRDHLSQSEGRASDLQNKLRSLASELKILKAKEDILRQSTGKSRSGVRNEAGDSKTHESVEFGRSQHEESMVDQVDQSPVPQCLEQTDLLSPEDSGLEMESVNKDISSLQDSISSTEMELQKLSVRKDFLGRDSNGRCYWSFFRPGARPCILACGDFKSKDRHPEEFITIPDSDKWSSYVSDDDIEMLINWLKENNGREKELQEFISQFQANIMNGSELSPDNIFSTGEPHREVISADNIMATQALTALQNRHGGLGEEVIGMHRCECLELLWPTKSHCPSCHQSFPTLEDLRLHSTDNCKAASSSVVAEIVEISGLKKPKLNSRASFPRMSIGGEEDYSDCPFNFHEIMTRFTVQCSIKETVNEIGLISSGGMPSFSVGVSPYLSDPCLSLGSPRKQHHHSRDSVGDMDKKEPMRFSRYPEGGSSIQEGFSGDILPGTERDRGRLRESSSRPLLGKASQVLRFLKSNLLDMDAAIPEDGLRTSRSTQEKRCAWRAYVKSSRSIYEMIQALIIFEDMIKSEYLRNDWWFWSSPSTAAKITTLSALALRIYSLDAAIYYEKLHSGSGPQIEIPEPCERRSRSSPMSAEAADPFPISPRIRSRGSKRRRD